MAYQFQWGIRQGFDPINGYPAFQTAYTLDQFVIRVVHILGWSPTKARNTNSLWYSVFNCKEKTWIHTFPKGINRKGIELYLNSTCSYYLYTNITLQSRDTTEIQNSEDNIKYTWQHSILYIIINAHTLYIYIICLHYTLLLDTHIFFTVISWREDMTSAKSRIQTR